MEFLQPPPDDGDDSEDTPRQTPVPGAMSPDRSRELLARIAFLEAEADKLLEHSRRCCGHAEEMQGLLVRLDAQKAALERLLQSDDALSPELDAAWMQPCDLTEQTARVHLLWLRRLLHELAQAVESPTAQQPQPPSSDAAVVVPGAASGPARQPGMHGRRRRDAPTRIFPDLDPLDIAAVQNDGCLQFLSRDRGGLGRIRRCPTEAADEDAEEAEEVDAGWKPLPRQTLYCVVGDARELAVIGLGGEPLARVRLRGDEAGEPLRNLERINFLRCSGRLLLSDFHSLYLCDLRCRVLRSLHTFSWIVGHCVDEQCGQLFIVDRVNQFVSVYGLEGFEERGRLDFADFTDGISSICILNRLLFVSDRGANAVFVFSADSLEPACRWQLRNPLFITTDWSSCLYVTVGGRDNTVQILDSQGQLRRKLSGGRGTQPGQFGSPGGLTVAFDGSELFVCDLDNRRIQVFRL